MLVCIYYLWYVALFILQRRNDESVFRAHPSLIFLRVPVYCKPSMLLDHVPSRFYHGTRSLHKPAIRELTDNNEIPGMVNGVNSVYGTYSSSTAFRVSALIASCLVADVIHAYHTMLLRFEPITHPCTHPPYPPQLDLQNV